jgi:hypothetical protein
MEERLITVDISHRKKMGTELKMSDRIVIVFGSNNLYKLVMFPELKVLYLFENFELVLH